jgi:WD40 repeat protein
MEGASRAQAARRERYDAFISYSHALDGRLAPSLQEGLHRFAKPWHRLRALRVFRDQTSLSANPALWTSIVDALDNSRWFILMASPEAARSEWVGREVDHWCATGPRDRLLLVLTSGEISWDSERNDFDWNGTTAIPPTLRGRLSQEPRFVDLRWARHDHHVSLGNPRFVEAVADVSATLQGRPKDELTGEDVRQHRRTRRVVKGVIALLSAMLAAAIYATVVAIQQRDRARTEARVATSRLLAAQALSTADDQIDLAALFAAQAFSLQDNAQSRASLVQVLLRTPSLAGYLADTKGATAVASSAAAWTLAVGTDAGTLSLWDEGTLRRTRSLARAHASGVTSMAFTSNGRLLATGGSDGRVRVWNVSDGQRLKDFRVDSPVIRVAFSEDGGMVAAATEKGVLSIWGTDAGALLHQLTGVSSANPRIALKRDGTLTIGDGQGRVERWKLAADTPPALIDEKWAGAGQPLVAAYTKDLGLFAGLAIGQNTAYISRTTDGSFLHDDNLAGPAINTDAMAFSEDGAWLATAGAGRLVLWDVQRNRSLEPALTGVPGRARDVVFARNDELIVVAAERGAGAWRRASHPVIRSLHAAGAQPVSEVPNVLRGAVSAAFSADGRQLAWSVNTSPQSWIVIWDLERDVEIGRTEAVSVVGFSADGREIAGTSDFEQSFVIADVKTGRRTSATRLPAGIARAADAVEDKPWIADNGKGLGASIAMDGVVTLWNVETQQPVARVPVNGAFEYSALVFDPRGGRLAVASPGGAMSLIDVAADVWHARVCAIAARGLSESEWAQYVGARLDAPPACPQNPPVR